VLGTLLRERFLSILHKLVDLSLTNSSHPFREIEARKFCRLIFCESRVPHFLMVLSLYRSPSISFAVGFPVQGLSSSA
jgi:hypothetical protein